MLDHRLILGTKSLDMDNALRGFVQGQALRDVYDQKQKKNHLNEIAKLATTPEKEQYATNKGGRYADDLMQEMEARRAASQKALLNNAKLGAETHKIYAEASAKNADANDKKYGVASKRVKDTRTLLRGISRAYDFNTDDGFKKGFVALNRSVGMMTALGMIPPDKAKNVLMLYRENPRGALEELKTYAGDDPDYIKALTPKTNTIDTGGQMVVGNTDPYTGEWTQQATLNKSVDPTQQANFESRYAGQRYTADQNLAGKQYGADLSYNHNMYKTQTGNQLAVDKMNADQLANFANGNNGKPLTVNEKLKINEKIASGKNAVLSAQNAIDRATSLLNHPGLSGAVGLSSIIPNRPGSNAYNFANDVESMKSQLFLPAIQAMRGMGSLSEQEGAKVQAAIESLDVGVDENIFKQKLNDIIVKMSDLQQIAQTELTNNQAMLGQSNQQTPSQAPNMGKTYSRAKLANLWNTIGKPKGLSFNQFKAALIQKGISVQ